MITFDQKIAKFLLEWSPGGWPWGNLLLCIIAVVLTLVLTFAIGLERERRGGTTGLNTHMLVGLGSCVIMIVSIYGFPAIFTSNGGETGRDVARLAASIVSGIGFLGAGVIIYSNGGIKGITTASTIWVAMAIGLACGSFNFILGTFTGIIAIIFLYSFAKIEKLVHHNYAYVVASAKKDIPILTIVTDVAKKYSLYLIDIVCEIEDKSDQALVEISFRVKSNSSTDDTLFSFIKDLNENSDIVSAHLVHRP